MRFPRGFADDVRSQSDIVRVVSDYVTLKKRGSRHVACCPFHSEKTPSFGVSADRGLYYCFGCGAGGDVFGFVMQIEGCSYPDAIKIVADKNGIPIPAQSESEDHRREAHDREVVLRLNEWAAEYFEKQLLESAAAAHARDYVESRGINDETRKLFRIGFAPDRWDGLLNHLHDLGATDREIEISGLAVRKESGGLYDRFRGRVMFPILDSQGRPIAFGGRVIGQGEPKYLNSPETAVYTKGRNLYGLSLARNEIRRLEFAILVEGYLDCIIPFQEGVNNIVASLGTALTDGQVRLLRRYMEQPQIIVNFDPDSAGEAATLRSIELLLAEGFKVNILRMPTAQDPDEYVRSHGAAAFRNLFKTTQPYIEYIIDRATAQYDLSRPTAKVEAVNAILPHLARMRDRVARADYAVQIADRLKIDNKVVRDELKRVATNRQQSMDSNRLRASREVKDGERQLLELLLANQEVRRAIMPNLNRDDYSELRTQAIFDAVVYLDEESIDPDFAALTARLEDDNDRALIPALLMGDGSENPEDEFEVLFKRATQALCSLRSMKLERRLEQIQIEIGKAERESNSELVLRLHQERMEVKKRRLAISASP